MNPKKLTLLFFASAFVVGGLSPSFAATDDGTVTVAPMLPSEKSQAGKRDGSRVQGALEQRLAQLDKTLHITADQKKQIQDIWAKEATGAKGAKGKEGNDLRAALEKTRNEVRAVLTPEQQKKFDKMKPEGRAGRALGRKRSDPNPFSGVSRFRGQRRSGGFL